ncbi:MAG: metallophosphoesterase family protein [Chloroflexi bacterium]|nr:metallophosphoesterase family protein [Chloroflexota bacterium]
MQVLVVSDHVSGYLHTRAVTEYARGVDLILSCGDLPADYLEYITTMLNVPLYYVMGNHGGAGGDRTFPEGGENLDGRVVEYKGLLLAGLEGSMRYNDRPQFQYTDNEMRAKVALLTPALVMNRARYGRYLDVLVTHAPPFGIHDASDLPHRGFKAFGWLIEHYQPRYVLHGHKHVYDTREETITQRGATTIINTYGYRLLVIEPLKTRAAR